MANIAPVFLLPNVRNIYLGGLFQDEEDERDNADGTWDLPPAKLSSVERLYIEAAAPDSISERITTFVSWAKALLAFVVKGCELNDFDLIVDQLGREHGETLETFVFDSEEGHLSGYRCSIFSLDECCGGFRKLRIFTVDMADVRLDSTHIEHANSLTYGMGEKVGSHEHLVKYFATCIPDSVEVLIFRCSEILNKHDMDAVGDGLTELLERGKHSNLQTVYLDEVLESTNGDVEECYDRLIQCGKEYCINVVVGQGSTGAYIEEISDALFH